MTREYALGWNAAVAKIVKRITDDQWLEEFEDETDESASYVAEEIADRLEDLYVAVPSPLAGDPTEEGEG